MRWNDMRSVLPLFVPDLIAETSDIIASDCSPSLTTARVRIPAGPCEKVVSDFGIRGGIHVISSLLHKLQLWRPSRSMAEKTLPFRP